MPVYNDFDIMLRDIVGYIRATGAEVLPADDPHRGMFGFSTLTDPPVRWEMPVLLLRGALDRIQDESFRTSLRQSLQTAQGRRAVVGGLVESARTGLASEAELARYDTRWHEAWQRGMQAQQNGTTPQRAMVAIRPMRPDLMKPSSAPAEPTLTIYDRLLLDEMDT
jgi:hypothetical protein